MKKQNLKQHSNDFYQKQELNQHKLDHLLELSDTINAGPKNQHWQNIAAAILIAVIIPIGVQQYLSNTAHPELVPQEIALNHSKQLALEFNANSTDLLDKMMTKLDFKLASSSNPHLKGLNILGGRYCSIQGNLAAQIRLTDNNGTIFTLYQTPLTETLKSVKTGTLNSGNVKITQWQEATLFFGLATTAIKFDN